MVESVSSWQWVIHGDSLPVRRRLVRWLESAKGDADAALAAALCGRGDMVEQEIKSGQFRIRPRGCGQRMCPRCSRQDGVPFLRRVEEHLSEFPHGYIYHGVFTQRVEPGEVLTATRERFEYLWNRYMGILKRRGVENGLVVVHCTRSRLKGWHYHVHVLMESEGPLDTDDLKAQWLRILVEKDPRAGTNAPYFRVVSEPGEPFEIGPAGQGDMWSEAQCKTASCLQYMLRDVLQGTENWLREDEDDSVFQELAELLAHCRMRRLFGSWRRTAAVRKEGRQNESEPEVEGGEESTGRWLFIAHPDGLRGMRECGSSSLGECLRFLERTCRNSSSYGQRFVRFCRMILRVEAVA